MGIEQDNPLHLCRFTSHHRLASPIAAWEKLKIGVGAPPILTEHGWLIIYHGVSELEGGLEGAHSLIYSAGVMVLSKENPRSIVYRSAEPILTPRMPEERVGVVGNVVFPTGIDRRDDLNQVNRLDVYYGMADDRVGVASFTMPTRFPAGEKADPPGLKDPFSDSANLLSLAPAAGAN